MKTYLQFLIIFIVVSLVNSPKESLADKNCPKNGETIWTDCFGSKTSKSGDKYVGEWKKGVPQGKGTYAFSNGTKYSGVFHRGYRHGKGTYIFPNGDKYVGDFRNGQRHGKGIVSSADGFYYEGVFLNDAIVFGKGRVIKSSTPSKIPENVCPGARNAKCPAKPKEKSGIDLSLGAERSGFTKQK